MPRAKCMGCVNMKTVSLTSAEYRALKDSGQMTDIGALDGTYGGDACPVGTRRFRKMRSGMRAFCRVAPRY